MHVEIKKPKEEITTKKEVKGLFSIKPLNENKGMITENNSNIKL